MGKNVIKTTPKGEKASIEERDLKEIEAATMTFCAYDKIISGLNREGKKSALYAAGIILKSIADKVDDSEPEEERENGNNSD